MNQPQIDIEHLVAYEGVEYKLSSGNRGLQINIRTCPHCHNQNWKVYLNADSGLGNCFVCGMGFNIQKFIKLSRGFANYFLVNKYLDSHLSNFSYKPKKQFFVNNKANKDWKFPLNNRLELEEDIPQYLKDRNINAKIAKRFDLRICNNGFYKYEDHAGKIRMVDFSNRIIIPINDIYGKPATFQGRDITGTSPKKYLFPNMLPGTARYIYNAHHIIKNRTRRVILNEGVFDVFATTQAIESEAAYNQWGVCGTFGKHFSIQRNVYEAEDQLADLAVMKESGVEEFVIMWDGEPKARESAIKAGLALRNYGFPVTVALGLPDGCDPAESTKEQVLAALDNRQVPTNMMLVRHRIKS